MNPRDMLRLMRPRQWTKNLAVFAAIIFAVRLHELPLLGRVALAFVALCLVSGGLYAANDATDADKDREHPVKRDRPVAAGRVSRAQAYGLAVVCMVLGLSLAAALGWPFLLAVAAFAGSLLLTRAFIRLLASPLPASDPTVAVKTPTPIVENVTVDIVNVEVMVIDKKGNRVRGLTKDDFELIQDGRPQRITNFFAVEGGALAPEPLPPRLVPPESLGSIPMVGSYRWAVWWLPAKASGSWPSRQPI